MLVLVVRIVLTALAIGFLAWLGYILYLGLESFFCRHDKLNNLELENNNNN